MNSTIIPATRRTIHPAALTNAGHAVLAAYADCHGSEQQRNLGYDTRSLRFRSRDWLPVSEAMPIFDEALGRAGYNDFCAELLALLPAGAQVQIAREDSPCIYVKGNPFAIAPEDAKAYGKNAKAHPQFEANEISYDPATDCTRLWWD